MSALSLVILVLLALPWGGTGGRSLATPGPARVGDEVVAHTLYVVQPGDTLWGIASKLSHGGDPRPLEQQLAGEIGSDSVFPGERIALP